MNKQANHTLYNSCKDGLPPNWSDLLLWKSGPFQNVLACVKPCFTVISIARNFGVCTLGAMMKLGMLLPMFRQRNWRALLP